MMRPSKIFAYVQAGLAVLVPLLFFFFERFDCPPPPDWASKSDWFSCPDSSSSSQVIVLPPPRRLLPLAFLLRLPLTSLSFMSTTVGARGQQPPWFVRTELQERCSDSQGLLYFLSSVDTSETHVSRTPIVGYGFIGPLSPVSLLSLLCSVSLCFEFRICAPLD